MRRPNFSAVVENEDSFRRSVSALTPDALLEAVFAEVDELVDAIEDMPHWLSEANVDVPDTCKVTRLIAEYKRAVFAALPPAPPPSTIPEVVARIASFHKSGDTSYHALSVDRVGESWSLCDGHCALLVLNATCDQGSLPKIEARFSDDAERKFTAIFKPVRALDPVSASLSQLEAWEAAAISYEVERGLTTKVGRIGGQAVDATRVSRFATSIARVIGGDIFVRADTSMMQVGFSGAGWEAIVMGMRIEGAQNAPELLGGAS